MSVTYVPLNTPPNLDAPTSLALAWTTDGLLQVSLVQPTQPTFLYTYVQIDFGPSPDWVSCILMVIPRGQTHAALAGVPNSTLVTARAWGADGHGNTSVTTAEVSITTGSPAAGSDTMWAAVVTGDETFVWLDGELVYEKVVMG